MLVLLDGLWLYIELLERLRLVFRIRAQGRRDKFLVHP